MIGRVRLRQPSGYSAFTLLELIVVLAIASVLASLVMLSLRGHFQQAALAKAVDQVVEADRLSRQLAMQHPERAVQLQFDTQRHRVAIDGGQRTIQLTRRVAFDEFKQLDADGWRASSETIDVANNGTSPTYAIRLSVGTLPKWLVVFGLSGQAKVYDRADVLPELSR